MSGFNLQRLALLSVPMLLLPGAVAAEFRDHEAHVHGHGHLTVAVEAGIVQMELTAPSADIVGFEHEPSTEAQHAAVDQAVATLSDGLMLFTFPADAACRLEAVDIDSPLIEADHHGDHHADKPDAEHDHGDHHDAEADHGTDHDHAEADHGTDHDHADHDHANHDHGEHDAEYEHGGEMHSDFVATYQVACADPAALTHIDVGVFAAFPRSVALAVQAITETGQSAVALTPDSARLVLP